ncbi:MAG TPA: DNA mismatch repair protein MutS, partial [Chitinophagales bacterium]|nr:DNA mismatch repair protein MutS [Chitinophagales bacterium]
ISSGESTFMVEMTETASIMHNISSRSLILLDEIGRGTSTYDGISIAWALAEYLHTSPKGQPKTLFATHYHELTELAEKFERVKNFTIAVREMGNKVIFLRKLVEGAAERSFGIHVAQMAGMPVSIVRRANEILATLEQKHIEQENPIKSNLKQMARQEPQYQMSIFDMSSPELQRLKAALEAIDPNTLTPIEALMKLNELKKMVE